MGDTSKLVAAPAEVPLGDLTLYMSPLTDVDIAELNEWVRARYIANADQAARMSGLGEAHWRSLVTLAMDRALSLVWYQQPGSTLMATIEGVVRIAWQSCKKNMPELTFAELRAKLTDPRNAAMFRERFARHNAVPSDGPKGGKPGKATRPSQKKNGTPRSTKRPASPTSRSPG